jgi:hypothetical protein
MIREPDVEAFLTTVADPERRRDAEALCGLMAELTGEQATMWGSSIIGFGRARYRYATGREGDTALACFSPRRRELVVYLVGHFDTDDAPDLARLGPHRTGKGCLYLKRLADVDQTALRSLIERSILMRRDMDPNSQAGQ